MTLTEAIARDPPRTRRFRLLAPLLVLLCLAALAILPGVLFHNSADDQDREPQSIEGFVTYQGR